MWFDAHELRESFLAHLFLAFVMSDHYLDLSGEYLVQKDSSLVDHPVCVEGFPSKSLDIGRQCSDLALEQESTTVSDQELGHHFTGILLDLILFNLVSKYECRPNLASVTLCHSITIHLNLLSDSNLH